MIEPNRNIEEPKLSDGIAQPDLEDQKTEETDKRPSDFVDDLTFGQKLRLTWRGKTKAGRIAGTVLDIGEVFLPRQFSNIRTRIQSTIMDKPKLMSKTVWSAILIALTAILQALGVSFVDNPETMQVIYNVMYPLAGAFGLFGLRDAIGKQIKQQEK